MTRTERALTVLSVGIAVLFVLYLIALGLGDAGPVMGVCENCATYPVA